MNFAYIESAVDKPEVPPARGTAEEVYIEVLTILGSCIVYASVRSTIRQPEVKTHLESCSFVVVSKAESHALGLGP